MKQVVHLFAPYYTELFNRSLAAGNFASEYKDTRISKNPGPGFLGNFQTRKPGFVRRRKPGFDSLAFSAICTSLVLAKLVNLNRNS